MPIRRFAVTALAVAALAVGTGAGLGSLAPATAHTPATITARTPAPAHAPTDGIGLEPALSTWRNNRIAVLMVAVHANELAAAATTAREHIRAVGNHPTNVSTITGSCAAMKPAGFPDWIIQRESGGNPNARNASGAFGCAQLMPMHLTGDYPADWARLYAGGAGLCNWQPPNYCAGH